MIRAATSLVTVIVVAAVGCSSTPKLTADQYYKEASEAFTKKNYELAATRYKELLDQYPFSEHAEEAELRIAHSQYKNHKYPEAIAAFNDFQRMHPMSPHLPEVYFLLGKSYMDQMTTTDRDQGAAENAHGWFRVVIERYPASEYAPKARRRLDQCRHALAEHELYIARYYFKRKNLKAGENRVKGIVENYSDTTVATPALEALADAYARAGDEMHEKMARAAVEERKPGDAEAESRAQAAKAKKSEKHEKHEKDATPAGDPAPTLVPVAFTPPTAHGPATLLLLADLTARYGPSQGVSTAATAPSLLDPVAPKAAVPAGGKSGGGPIGEGPDLGGY